MKKYVNIINMRILLLITISIINVTLTWNQEDEWYRHELDSLISINLPGEVYELDTIVNELKLFQLFSSVDNSQFIVQRIHIEENNEEKTLSNLPYNEMSLEKLYSGFRKGIIKKSPFKKYSIDTIYINNLKGYKLILKDSINQAKYEIDYILLNHDLYSFMYINVIDFNEFEKELFLNSIKIQNDITLNQFCGSSPEQKIGYFIGEFLATFVLLVIILIFLRKKIIGKNQKTNLNH